jgi:hypothetical protein
MSTNRGITQYVGVLTPMISSLTGSLNSGSYPDTAHGTYANTGSHSPSFEDRDRGFTFFRGPTSGSLPTPTGGGTVLTFKMTGYYATTNTWEVWTSTGTPNTTPPSGHPLTFISYVVL